ncbi:MAG: TRAP transporter substrate-binding protein DctP [Dehalococcoidia bacterium]|nr:TRAP transporter substrate-binding protein DctP [Dehalococcoidia bacterium]
MPKRFLLLLAAGLMVISVAIMGCAPEEVAPPSGGDEGTTPEEEDEGTTPAAPSGEVINWVGQAALPSGMPPHEGLVRISDTIGKMSGGRLNMTAHPAGAVVPATEEWKGINSGVLDFCAGGGSYMVSDMRFQTVFSQCPGGMPPLPLMIFHRQVGYEVMNKWYKEKGFAFIDLGGGFHGLAESWIHTNKPLTGPDDLKGMKMRASGDAGKILEGMGVGTVFMPLGEIFEAMQRGVIDAFECSCPAFDYSMGLDEAATYTYLSPSRAPTEVYQFLVSEEKFNELPDDLKAIVQDAAVAEAVNYFTMLNSRNADAITAMRDGGEIIEPLPASINDAFAVEVKKFYAEEVTKFPELEDYMVNNYLPFANDWNDQYGFPYPVLTSLD